MTKQYKYLELLTTLSIIIAVVSSVISNKIIDIGFFTVSISILLFPITYILADLYTEVYGYGVGRKVIWKSLFFSTLAMFLFQMALAFPISSYIDPALQTSYEQVLGSTWRIILAAWLVMFAAGFANDYVIAKMKIFTKGKYLWSRTITSTAVSEFIDTLLFYPIAFYGILPNEILVSAMVGGFTIKVLLETVLTPFTYFAVAKLKKLEQEDYYDYNTNFNPFEFVSR